MPSDAPIGFDPLPDFCHRQVCLEAEQMPRKPKCHGAVLALMAWYLIVPPTLGWPTYRLNPSAPISQWRVVRGFEGASACEAYLREEREKTGPITVKFRKTEDMTVPATMAALCIFSDEPREGK